MTNRLSGEEAINKALNVYADALAECKRENKRLRDFIEKVDNDLTNMQPHIPQACQSGKTGFIDNYINPLIKEAREIISHKDSDHG